MTTYEITASITVRAVEPVPSTTGMVKKSTIIGPDTLRDELRSRALKGQGPVDPLTGCQTHRNRHGVIQLGSTRARVSALLWEAHHGQVLPRGHCVWRACGTSKCTRGEHLMAGPVDAMNEYRRGWHQA